MTRYVLINLILQAELNDADVKERLESIAENNMDEGKNSLFCIQFTFY